MTVRREAAAPPGQKRLIAIGNFDGVHLGHQHLLRSVVTAATQEHLTPCVLTFDPHPALVLGRGKPKVLTPLERKLELLHGLDRRLEVSVQRFDLALAAMSPRQFAEQLARERGAARVIVGGNFRFGKNRAGDLGTLERLGAELGFRASATDLFDLDGQVVSSSRVRQTIEQGRLGEAARLLGRPHSLFGEVVRGDGRGRTIGFPTANLSDVEELVPRHGVYAVRVRFADAAADEPPRPGVANIGVRPTVASEGETLVSIEVHLMDAALDLYGRKLRLELVSHLRDERRFSGLDALRAQIGEDVEAARRALEADS